MILMINKVSIFSFILPSCYARDKQINQSK